MARRGQAPQGLNGVREYWCRPCGTRVSLPTFPGTYVPGYHIPPLRGWRWMVLAPPLSDKLFHRSPTKLFHALSQKQSSYAVSKSL
jgi:hypothetical protein